MPISEKQKMILAFPYTKKYQSLICDGAVRTGKTSIMTIAFIDWAMREFDQTNFAICGKTVGSAIKNIVVPYMALSYAKKRYRLHFTRSDNKLVVSRGRRKNVFYIYGGKDESSYMLIQGITLAGVLFDEVALMTRSFVEQALARCLSHKDRRYFFNCNPGPPNHWFYVEWIKEHEKHRALHLHFLMPDNPILDKDTIREAEAMYSGVFYQRYVLGEWVQAEGLIYPNYKTAIVPTATLPFTEYQISIDYGIHNPTCFGLFGRSGGKWYMLKEYYHSGRESHEPKTDAEYYDELVRFAEGHNVRRVIVDPSASSFITLVRKSGRFPVKEADNAVLDGIRNTSTAMSTGKLFVMDCCKHMIEEFGLYAWDAKSTDDRPIKANDHMCDLLRYFVQTTSAAPQAKARGVKPTGW